MWKHLLLISLAAAASSPVRAQIWSLRTPRLQWEGRPLGIDEAAGLLANVCSGRIKATTVSGEKGFGCDYPPLSNQGGTTIPTFRTDRLTPPKPLPAPADRIWFYGVSKVIYGHFLSPSSNDAALSGWAGETHPEFAGGTLLLTGKGGQWMPVWYKSAVITRFCREAQESTGRDILLCEEEDGGMGHSYPILYTRDFTRPASPWDAAVFLADSYLLECREQQQQAIERIRLRSAGGAASPFLTVFARHGRKHLSESEIEQCAAGRLRTEPAVHEYRIDFLLGTTLSPAPWSARAAQLFRAR